MRERVRRLATDGQSTPAWDRGLSWRASNALLLIVAGLASACGQPVRPGSCAAMPVDFHRFHEVDQWGIEPVFNVIDVRRNGTIFWNGTALAGDQLDRYLAVSAQLNPMPRVALTFDRGVSCGIVEQVRLAMRRHLACASSRACLQGSPLP